MKNGKLILLFSPLSLAGLAGPGSFEYPARYWRHCSRSSDCYPVKFLTRWPDTHVMSVGCDRQAGYCSCRKGYMDADGDPANGCELRIQEKLCRFGSCNDHGVTFGEECGNWDGRLTCSGDDDWSCCTKTEIFVEGTVSLTTTSATSTTTNEDYNANSFEKVSDSIPDAYVCVDEQCISRVNCGDSSKIFAMTPKLISSLIELEGEVSPNHFRWPFMALIYFQTEAGIMSGEIKEECEGTIIHDKWVITAGHCCDHAEKATVHFGEPDEFSTFPFSMSMTWENMFIHVNMHSGHHDYCMLKLPESISIMSDEECVSPFCTASICLPDEQITHGDACWVAGWAGSSFSPANERVLRQTGVNVFSHDYCHWTSHYSSIQDREFCAGLPDLDDNGWQDVDPNCVRGHGGPLVCLINDKFVLRGIMSWGDCQGQGRPGIYADVFKERGWILSMIDRYTGQDHSHDTSTEHTPHTHSPDYYWHTHSDDYNYNNYYNY